LRKPAHQVISDVVEITFLLENQTFRLFNQIFLQEKKWVSTPENRKGISYDSIDSQEGDHAIPGTYSRKAWELVEVVD
jgi:hypothetical protein